MTNEKRIQGYQSVITDHYLDSICIIMNTANRIKLIVISTCSDWNVFSSPKKKKEIIELPWETDILLHIIISVPCQQYKIPSAARRSVGINVFRKATERPSERRHGEREWERERRWGMCFKGNMQNQGHVSWQPIQLLMSSTVRAKARIISESTSINYGHACRQTWPLHKQTGDAHKHRVGPELDG